MHTLLSRLWNKYYPLFLITAVGLALRLYHFATISLWHDEAFSALLIKYSWSEMMYRIGLDVHPPLYYIALRFWHYLLGDSLPSLRGFSVACGVLTIIVVYVLVQKFFASRTAAVLSAVLVATNVFQITNVGGEARMYTLGALLNVAAAGSLMYALRLQTKTAIVAGGGITGTSDSKRIWLWYGIFAILGASLIYTHYYLAFSLIALGLYGLLFHFKNYLNYRDLRAAGKRLIPFIAACAGIGILFIPWIKTFLFQLGQVQGGYWIPPIDRWSIPSTFWDLSLGVHTSMIPSHWIIVVVTVLSFIMLAGLLIKSRQPEKWLLVFSVLAPFVGAIGFYLLNRMQGHNSSVYLVRYFAFAGIFYSMGLGVWLSEFRLKTVSYIIIAAVVVINLFGFIHFWDDLNVASKPGMAAASAYLQKYAKADDKIIAGTSFEFFNLKYYLQEYAKISIVPTLYTGGQTKVEDLPHFAGTAILTEQDLSPDFKTAAKKDDTVWLIWTYAFGSNKPTTPDNWVQIDQKGYDDARPYVGTTVYVTEYHVN